MFLPATANAEHGIISPPVRIEVFNVDTEAVMVCRSSHSVAWEKSVKELKERISKASGNRLQKLLAKRAKLKEKLASLVVESGGSCVNEFRIYSGRSVWVTITVKFISSTDGRLLDVKSTPRFRLSNREDTRYHAFTATLEGGIRRTTQNHW